MYRLAPDGHTRVERQASVKRVDRPCRQKDLSYEGKEDEDGELDPCGAVATRKGRRNNVWTML